MKVFANGFPKCGNHALVKSLELLGLPAEVNHVPFSGALAVAGYVFIKRDPRDVIVSWLRFNHDAVTPGKFLARFRRFESKSLAEEMAEYEGWLSLAHVVRYEDLIANDKAMRRIAKHLGVPYIEGAWEELPGLTRTWNAVRSDYRAVWTPEVIKAWYAEGGGELLARWGY